MIELIFNLIGSGIHDNKRWALFNVGLEKQKNPNAYFEYELHCAKPVIDWCKQHDMDFEIEDAHYAMQLAFIFKEDSDALAFKLRWL